MAYQKKTVIITGYRCNNRCRFCIDANKRNFPEKSTQKIIAEMADARKRGRTYLEIIGGEETIRPDFAYLVKMAKRLGFETILMATNGRMFAYKDYAIRIIDAGITDIVFSIHGHNAKLHDYLTQVEGSFHQLFDAINNIKSLSFKNIGSNTTIVKQNYKHLPQIGKFIYNLGIRNAEFIFVDPTYGGAHDDFYGLVPKISQAAFYIKKCLDIGGNSAACHWHIRYVPLCHFIDYEDQISELHEVRTFHTEHLAPDFDNLHIESSRKKIGRYKSKKCMLCKYDNMCEGIWRQYVYHYGDSELIPIK